MTVQYIAVKCCGNRERLLDSVLSPPLRASRHDDQGWALFVLHEFLEPATLDKLIVAGSERSGLAAAVFTQSGDFAYCVGAHDAEISFRLVLNERVARVYKEGMWALKECEAFAGSAEWRPLAAASAARWASLIPQSVAVDDVLEILNRDWYYPEEAALDLLDALGTPLPPTGER